MSWHTLIVFVHIGIKVFRRILNLPHDAHTWLLGSLIKQNHIKKQFIARNLRFLICMLN